MRTARPLLPGEHNPDECASLCGRMRARPALLCQNCLDEFHEQMEQKRQEENKTVLSRLFAGRDEITIEEAEAHYLRPTFPGDGFRYDELRQMIMKVK